MKNLYIGIDSGGTNCRVGLGDASGRIIHAANFDSLHYSQAGAEAFSDRISGVLNEFCAGINLELNSLSGICLGAAGARHTGDKRKLKNIISGKTNFGKIVVESDTAVAMYAAFRDDDGLLLISGTGSVLYGKHRGENVRIGGWGKLLGDEGSSHSISLNLLKRIAVMFDESDAPGRLEKKLEEEHGLTRDNIISEIYHGDFTIHNLTPFVIRMAEEGDEVCAGVVENETEGLLRLFRTFKGRFPDSVNVEVAFLGSVIDNDNFFRRSLEKKIAVEFGDLFRVRNEKINTLKGALKIAVNSFE